MLGTCIGKTGLTVHEALGRAIATAEHLGGLPREIRRLRLPSPQQIDPESRAEIKSDVRMVVDRLNDADRIPALWRDAGKGPLRNDNAEDIASELLALSRAIEALRTDVEDSPLRPFLADDAVCAEEAPVTMDRIRTAINLAAHIEKLPDPERGIDPMHSGSAAPLAEQARDVAGEARQKQDSGRATNNSARQWSKSSNSRRQKAGLMVNLATRRMARREGG